VVEGKKDEGATRRVKGAWTLGAAWARHLADLATARRNIVYGGDRVVWKCLVQLSVSMSNDDSKLRRWKLGGERAFQSQSRPVAPSSTL
jgi:hypothetical protein